MRIFNMRRIRAPLLISGILALFANIPQSFAATCKGTSPCSCEAPDGSTLNLSPLDKRDGKPRFSDVKVNANYSYSWNPCTSFSEGGCKQVAACQMDGGKLYYDIGDQSMYSFGDGGKQGGKDSVMLHYLSAESGSTRNTQVALVCDETKEDSISGEAENPPGTYHLTLTSKYACFKAAAPSPNNGDILGLSVGSIITISFFCLVVIYAVSGVLVMKFVKKAEGKEVIPNYSFWSGGPALVKDGFVFTYRKIFRRGDYGKL